MKTKVGARTRACTRLWLSSSTEHAVRSQPQLSGGRGAAEILNSSSSSSGADLSTAARSSRRPAGSSSPTSRAACATSSRYAWQMAILFSKRTCVYN